MILPLPKLIQLNERERQSNKHKHRSGLISFRRSSPDLVHGQSLHNEVDYFSGSLYCYHQRLDTGRRGAFESASSNFILLFCYTKVASIEYNFSSS